MKSIPTNFLNLKKNFLCCQGGFPLILFAAGTGTGKKYKFIKSEIIKMFYY